MAAKTLGLILAGGTSSRFGTDKAFVELEGRSLLAHVHGAVASACDQTWVLGRHGAEAAPYKKHAGDAKVVLDRADAGPVAALRDAVEQADAPWIVVAPVDAPVLTPKDVNRLLLVAKARNKIVHAETSTGPRFNIIAAPRQMLAERLAEAENMQGVVLPGIGLWLPERDGWNVNAPTDLPAENA